jgi:hypothetical protein
MNICLINASQPRGGNNDSYVDFRSYTTYEDAKWRSWHSIPCSLKSEFFAYNGQSFHECYKYDAFIVLFNHDPEHLIPFIKKLKLMGKKVAVGYHESFEDLMQKCSSDFGWLSGAKKLVKESDFYLNVCPSYKETIDLLFEKKSVYTYHAAPGGIYDHLKKSLDKREGVMISTRTFSQRIKRNTLWSLLEANEYCKKNDTFFTFVCEDNLNNLPSFENMKLINGPLDYNSWLELISNHKFVYGRDEASTLGQVMLDAAIVGVPAFGGNSENAKVVRSCNDIWSIDYDRDYTFKADILAGRCSMENIADNIRKAFGSA